MRGLKFACEIEGEGSRCSPPHSSAYGTFNSAPFLFFLQLHGLIVVCRLDIALGSAGFTVACFCHTKLDCTILALANQHITFLDFDTPTSFELRDTIGGVAPAYGSFAEITCHF